MFRQGLRRVRSAPRRLRRRVFSVLVPRPAENDDSWRDIADGLRGAARMAWNLATPFLRSMRRHRGLDPRAALLWYPGDDRVADPSWSWTHAIEIDAAPADVWPWVAQIGGDRAGFYSYQWLENLVGCHVHNAASVHPEWEVRAGDDLELHPKVPPLRVVSVASGRYFIAVVERDEAAVTAGKPWIEASWLFLVEPLPGERTRFISRYRAASSRDLATRLQFGSAIVEPIGSEMDRKMLHELKRRAEKIHCETTASAGPAAVS